MHRYHGPVGEPSLGRKIIMPQLTTNCCVGAAVWSVVRKHVTEYRENRGRFSNTDLFGVFDDGRLDRYSVEVEAAGKALGLKQANTPGAIGWGAGDTSNAVQCRVNAVDTQSIVG